METENNAVTALIPAYNEARNIEQTIKAVKNIEGINQVLVINDCSTDNTGELAAAAGADVINLPQNLGKGGALNYGLKQVKNSIVALVDADLGSCASEFAKLLEPVQNDKADMTIGRFPPAAKKGGFGFVTKLARKGIRSFTGLEMVSPLSGQRVLRSTVLEKIGGELESGFGVEVGLTIDVYRLGFRIREVPVNMTHAETGRDISGFLHRGKQFCDVLLVLLKRSLFK